MPVTIKTLTVEQIKEVFKLYEEFFGACTETVEPEDVFRTFEKLGCVEYRFGSKWSGHSKLWIEDDYDGNIEFRFGPNMDRTDSNFKEAVAEGERFKEAVKKIIP